METMNKKLQNLYWHIWIFSHDEQKSYTQKPTLHARHSELILINLQKFKHVYNHFRQLLGSAYLFPQLFFCAPNMI